MILPAVKHLFVALLVVFSQVGLGQIGFERPDTNLIDTIVCTEYTSPSGKVFTESGIYLDTILDPNGFDSVLTIHLTIPEITWQMLVAISGTGATVFSNATGYQWLNCNQNFKKINGKNERSMYTTFGGGGRFACELTLLGCKDTTECIDLIGLGLEEPVMTAVRAYPNPTTGRTRIDMPSQSMSTSWRILSPLGIWSHHNTESPTASSEIFLNGPAGIYYIRFVDEDGEHTIPVLKE